MSIWMEQNYWRKTSQLVLEWNRDDANIRNSPDQVSNCCLRSDELIEKTGLSGSPSGPLAKANLTSRSTLTTIDINSEGLSKRVKGIEPSYSAWKAAALPLSYTREQNR